jgi:hypothetical protein
MACEIKDKIKTIVRTEYIGNSLNVINDNFQTLRDEICKQDSTLATVAVSAGEFNSQIQSLSGATIPGAAKAWVKFDGSRDTNQQNSTAATERFLYKTLNIQSVYRKNQGDYRVYFTKPFNDNKYITTGSCSLSSTSDTGRVSSLIPYAFSPDFVDVRINPVVDPRHVSVIIF